MGDQELLADANLRFFKGVHYGLVGANGVGKCALSSAPLPALHEGVSGPCQHGCMHVCMACTAAMPAGCWARSTLLRAIGEGLVVGFPKNLRALYVDQLEDCAEQGSVLEIVMAADRDVVRWRQQAVLLQACAPLLWLPALGGLFAYMQEIADTFKGTA